MDNNETLYNKIAQYLKEKIENGEVQPNEKLPTESELAEMFNVSLITSKRALQELEKQQLIIRRRGSGSYVMPQKELSAAWKVQQSKVVALVMPYEISNVRLLEILKGASNFLSNSGYLITVLNIESNQKEEREVFSRGYRDFSGIIYYPGYNFGSMDLLYNLYLQHYPVVTIDKYLFDIPFSYVSTDNFGGVHQSISYLIGLGHSKIAFLTVSDLNSVSSVHQRFFGYCTALHDNGIPMREDFVRKISDKDELRDLMKEWLEKGVTAIQTENDDAAIRVIRMCEELSIQIPEQFSIVGYDNLISARYIKPELTTVEQDFYAIGELSAKTLLNQIKTQDFSQIKCLIPPKLIIRDSCGQVSEE